MLARTRRVLMLTAACVAGLELRAEAQSESPGVPPAADPAAVLLAPVLPDATRPANRPIDMPTPFEAVRSEPAARLAPVGDAGLVRVSDFQAARRDAADHPEPAVRAQATDDALDYLTDGKLRRDDDGRITRRRRAADDGDEPRTRRSDQLGDKIDDILGKPRGGGIFNRDRGLFKSDCDFDNFAAPVTNPFLFEDPRARTELRALFIYQKIPGGASLFQGGGAWFVGLQGRLAITDRFALVISKFGLTGFSPGSASPLDDSFGFSEIHLGGKYVFYRDPETKTILTGGATFQIPAGSTKNYQDTGRLSIVPYLSGGRRLWDTRFGAFNGLASAGYSFSTNTQRSDYFYVSGHLDFDVGDKGRFFPLVELNWVNYTSNGNSHNLDVEGRDLANLGAQRKGTGLLTIAAGARFKLNDRWEFGGAYELPLVGSKDLFQYRFTFDLTWRY